MEWNVRILSLIFYCTSFQRNILLIISKRKSFNLILINKIIKNNREDCSSEKKHTKVKNCTHNSCNMLSSCCLAAAGPGNVSCLIGIFTSRILASRAGATRCILDFNCIRPVTAIQRDFKLKYINHCLVSSNQLLCLEISAFAFHLRDTTFDQVESLKNSIIKRE